MKTRPLGEFDIYINDGNYGNIYPEKELFINEGIPFISASDFNGRTFNYEGIKFISEKLHFNILKKGHLKINDIVIVVRGNGIGKVGFFKDEIGECNMNAQLAFIRTNPNQLNPLYLYYLMSSQNYLELIQRFGTGSAQPQLPINRLKLVPIIEKDIQPQSQIAKVLSDLDAKIELNNKINSELEAMAKLIYDYWFVQFDFPNEDGKPYKSSGGKMVWNAELKREIPEGWEVKELSEIANITMGQSPPGESYNEEKIGTVFYQGCTDFGKRFPTIRKYTTQPTRFARISDILLSVRAPVGTMNISKEECCIGRGLAALNSKNNSMPYLFGVMSNLKQIFDRRNTDGTTFGAITKDDLFSIKVISPSDELIIEFDKIVGPMFSKQNTNEFQNIELTELRDWLLPMLMNGQVKVENGLIKQN